MHWAVSRSSSLYIRSPLGPIVFLTRARLNFMELIPPRLENSAQYSSKSSPRFLERVAQLLLPPSCICGIVRLLPYSANFFRPPFDAPQYSALRAKLSVFRVGAIVWTILTTSLGVMTCPCTTPKMPPAKKSHFRTKQNLVVQSLPGTFPSCFAKELPLSLGRSEVGPHCNFTLSALINGASNPSGPNRGP